MGAYSIYIGDHALDYQKEMLNPRHRPGDIPPEETLLSAKCEMSLNSGGSCQFVVPPTHPYYSEIKPMITEVIVVEIDNVLWFGRVTDISTDWLNRMTVNCEGPYAYLNDSVQPYQEYFNLTAREYLAMILSNHNSQVPEGRQIMIADVQESAIRLTGSLNYESSMELVQNFLSDYGGYIYLLMNALTGKAELYWISGRDLPSAQPVAYGVNLLDFNRVTNYEDICTSILPLGDDVEVQILYRDEETGQIVTDEEGKSITFRDSMPLALDMNRVQGLEPDENGIVPVVYTIPNERVLSNILIDGPFVPQYGRIIRRVLFPGITNIDTLRSAAYQWIWNQILGGISVTVDAVDLRFLDPENGRFYLGLSVECTSEAHNISEMLVITNIEIDILKVDKRITLGHLKEKTLSDIAGRGKKAEVTEILDMRQGFHPIRKIDKLGDLPDDANETDTIWVVTNGRKTENVVRTTNFYFWATANNGDGVFRSPEAYGSFLATEPYIEIQYPRQNWYPDVSDFAPISSTYPNSTNGRIFDGFQGLCAGGMLSVNYNAPYAGSMLPRKLTSLLPGDLNPPYVYSTGPSSVSSSSSPVTIATLPANAGGDIGPCNQVIAPEDGSYELTSDKFAEATWYSERDTSAQAYIREPRSGFSNYKLINYPNTKKGSPLLLLADDLIGTSRVGNLTCTIYAPKFVFTPASFIKMDSRRAGNITGLFGSDVVNGIIQNPFFGLIVNESQATVYNPTLNITTACKSWRYDFTTRSYTLYREDSSQIQVTFGDTTVTINYGGGEYYSFYYGGQDVLYYRGDRVETAIYRGNTVWDSLPHG